MVSFSVLFVLIGDPFLCEEKRKEILASLKKEFGENLPLGLHRAGEVSLKTLLAEARTLPFLAPAQVFSIREAETFTQSDLKLLETYFHSPHPRSFFILEAESLEKKHPFLEWARKSKQVFWLQRESGKLVHDFIREKLRRAGKKMTSDALHLLQARMGDSFVFLDSLMEQLILYSGEKLEIDKSDVEIFEEKLAKFEAGDLTQAMADRNLTKALAVLNDLLDLNVRDSASLTGLLHWQLRRFWEAKKALAFGISRAQVASRLRLFPSTEQNFFRTLERFSLQELEKILDELFDLDWRLKTGRAEGRYEMETWLVRAMG